MKNYTKLFLKFKYPVNTKLNNYSNVIDYTKTKDEILDIVSNNKFNSEDFYIEAFDLEKQFKKWERCFREHKAFFIRCRAYRTKDYFKLKESWRASLSDNKFNIEEVIDVWTRVIRFQLAPFISGSWNNIEKGINIKYSLKLCNTDKEMLVKPYKTIPKITFTMLVIPNIKFFNCKFPIVYVPITKKYLAKTSY